MTFWFLLAAVAVLFLYMRLEAGWLKVEHITVSNRIGMKLAVISDLHPSFCRISPDAAKDVMEREKPDLFLFLGDALDKPDHVVKAAAWLGRCAGGIPAFAVPGNHDDKFFAKNAGSREAFTLALLKEGIRLVSDEQFLFVKGTQRLMLTALDDLPHAQAPIKLTALDDLPHTQAPIKLTALADLPHVQAPTRMPGEAAIEEFAFHLVFTHNPQRIAELSEGYADFAVAGHFHGGQIWMPFGLEFHLFRREPLGRTGVRRGLHRVNGIPVYLTRGIGNVMFPLRLGARPEITIINL